MEGTYTVSVLSEAPIPALSCTGLIPVSPTPILGYQQRGFRRAVDSEDTFVVGDGRGGRPLEGRRIIGSADTGGVVDRFAVCFELAGGLPSSFRGKHGAVTYTLRASLGVSGADRGSPAAAAAGAAAR